MRLFIYMTPILDYNHYSFIVNFILCLIEANLKYKIMFIIISIIEAY